MKRFPIDTLKVDRSFVRDLTTDADDASIVNAVINMGKSLHMGVVAEGVETREQVVFLQEHSCPEAQGYYFSRPVVARTGKDIRSGERENRAPPLWASVGRSRTPWYRRPARPRRTCRDSRS
jgi:EAL domain-containing protein (putative c-di-GMP-specific phosphodiesterase class I)